MIDYDLAKKLKEVYKQADDFDKNWFSAKGLFKVANKVGAINDEDLKVISDEYDEMMAPVNKAKDKAQDYVLDHIMRFAWNTGLLKKDKSKD